MLTMTRIRRLPPERRYGALVALWHVVCKPPIRAGKSVVYGGAKHRAQIAAKQAEKASTKQDVAPGEHACKGVS